MAKAKKKFKVSSGKQRALAKRRSRSGRKQYKVKPHLAANPGKKPGQHRVKGHLAALPRKRAGATRKQRSAANKRAHAANRRSR